jgi:hypothetical protein
VDAGFGKLFLGDGCLGPFFDLLAAGATAATSAGRSRAADPSVQIATDLYSAAASKSSKCVEAK